VFSGCFATHLSIRQFDNEERAQSVASVTAAFNQDVGVNSFAAGFIEAAAAADARRSLNSAADVDYQSVGISNVTATIAASTGKWWRKLLSYSGAAAAASSLEQNTGTSNGHRNISKRFAYITMASTRGVKDDTHAEDYLAAMFALANSLQTVGSKYPLLVMTDLQTVSDGRDIEGPLRSLNAQPIQTQEVPAPKHANLDHWASNYKVAWQKVAVWRLTQFDKLIWMDTDAVVARNLDHLFEFNGTWSQQDRKTDRNGGLSPNKVCSGIMVVEPSEKTYDDLMSFADNLTDFPNGDQLVIDQYFREGRKEPIQMLPPWDADFGFMAFGHWKSQQLEGCGRCLAGRLPPAISNMNSSDLIPAFVHKADFTNQCFRLSKHLMRNCSLPVYGSYWRDNFCAATAKVGHVSERLATNVTAFCKDARSTPSSLSAPDHWPIT